MTKCTYHQWLWLLDHPLSTDPKRRLCVKICQVCGEIDWYIFPRKVENLEERIKELLEDEIELGKWYEEMFEKNAKD